MRSSQSSKVTHPDQKTSAAPRLDILLPSYYAKTSRARTSRSSATRGASSADPPKEPLKQTSTPQPRAVSPAYAEMLALSKSMSLMESVSASGSWDSDKKPSRPSLEKFNLSSPGRGAPSTPDGERTSEQSARGHRAGSSSRMVARTQAFSGRTSSAPRTSARVASQILFGRRA